MRIVLDTNVVSSAIAFGGALAPIAEALATDRLRLVVCKPLVDEWRDVLARPKLRLDPERADLILRTILLPNAEWWHLPDTLPLRCRDPKDDFLLELALMAKAPLCSGDRGVKAAAANMPELKFLTPAELAQALRQ